VGSRVATFAASGGHLVLGAALAACTTIDPGPNYVVADEAYDADFFFCRVEPQILVAKRCGPGDPALGDPANGCHFNTTAVSGMALSIHPPIDCGGGDRPVTRAGLGAGGPAQGNLEAVTLVMSRDVQTAPIYVRPLGANHPRAIFGRNDPAIDLLRQWAAR
jgi:hypothetical protein